MDIALQVNDMRTGSEGFDVRPSDSGVRSYDATNSKVNEDDLSLESIS